MDKSKSNTSLHSLTRLFKAARVSSHTPKPVHPVRKPRHSDLLTNIIAALGSREDKSSHSSSFSLSAQTKDQLSSLRQGLSEKLALLGSKCDPIVKLEAYQSTFRALASLDSPFSPLLRMLEAGYCEFIGRNSDLACRTQLDKLLLDYQATLDQDQSEKEALLAMLSRLRAENAALEASLAAERSKTKGLEKKLAFSLELSTLKTEDSQESIIESLKRREKTLLETLKTAKDRGFPVFAILKETMQGKSSACAARPSAVKAKRLDFGLFEGSD